MFGEYEPGTYTVTTGTGGQPEKVDVDVDRFDYDEREGLQAIKDNKIIATFRWWDSIVLKD
jgi:hypothetical protein